MSRLARAAVAGFPTTRFKGSLRPSQTAAVAIAQQKLAEGKRQIHIIAPPGSGKTVLGLYLWTQHVRRPALVLSPNSAIQAQWASRIDLFDFDAPSDGLVSTDPASPALITSLTYQSVTLPDSGGDDLQARAIALWQDKLIAKGQAKDPDEASVWIRDLARHNKNYYESRLGAYRKEVRDAAALGGEALATLHSSSLGALERLRDRGVGVIILDECHHLMGHWGRVLAAAREFMDNPVVIGLTATPPDRKGKAEEDVDRYEEFFGPIDYEVPVPAVVKDGFLAPYQDLAYFVRPTPEELAFVASADDRLHELVELVCVERPELEDATAEPPAEPLPEWLLKVLTERRLPTGKVKDWLSFERRDPEFAKAARRFLLSRNVPLPLEVPPLDDEPDAPELPEMETLVPVLDRYIRHRLRRSKSEADHRLAEEAIARLRTLGIQITETGSQACASPVGRVLGYSRSKTQALAPILTAERAQLGDKLRAVVVTDYEKTSATSGEIDHLLDDEAGGAIAAFKHLLRDPVTNQLNPVLVTGSSVLVDDDLEAVFHQAASQWLTSEGYDVVLGFDEQDGFRVVTGQGADWCPRVYVALITELFQRGLTQCLVGTRGLLGEGWDADKVNVLVDLTTVTTSMSVNQLRGRSIRLDPAEPQKLADNWDVVCLAPEFSKGLDDYQRFIAKHRTIFGVTDDGAIEKGVGHVHAAFTQLKPEGLEGSASILNTEMLSRAARRETVRELWRIGEPYHAEPVRALEAKLLRDGELETFPPFEGAKVPWNSKSLALAVGEAVLGALSQAGLLPRKRPIHVGSRAGGYVRVFLEDADQEESALFTAALHEVLGPLGRPRYVVPREVDRYSDTWLSKIMPSVLGRYLKRRERQTAMMHAVPSTLAKNKDLVAIFERHWNRHVSPGQAIYAHHGEGEKLVDEARRKKQTPSGEVHDKEIFI